MRARGIKPGFFKNEELADLAPLTRVLFVGLWCVADREGRLEDRPKRIKAEVLPYDSGSVEKMLDELAGAGFICRYKSDRSSFIQILNFSKHQMPHYKEAPSVIPAPPNWQDSLYPGGSIPAAVRDSVMARDNSTCRECGTTKDPTLDHIIPQSRGGQHTEDNLRVLCRSCNSAKNNRLAASFNQEPTLSQRRSEQSGPLASDSGLLTPSSLTPDSGLLTPEQSVVEPKPARPRPPSFKEEIQDVFAYWQEVMGKQSASLTPQRRDKIRIRLQGGYSVDQLKAAIDGCRASPHNMGDNDRQRPFNDLELILRNETNVEKFLELAPAHKANGGRTWTADDRAKIEQAVILAREYKDAEAQALCGDDRLWQEVVRRVSA